MSDDWNRDLAEARVTEAAAQRRRQRWEAQLLAEESTFEGMLIAAAESQTSLRLITAGGRTYHGILREVCADVVIMSTESSTTIIRITAVAVIAGHVAGTSPRRDGEGRLTMIDLLADLVGRRATVSIWTGSTCLSGDVDSVGDGVLALALGANGGRGGEIAYVVVESVSEVSVPVSS